MRVSNFAKQKYLSKIFLRSGVNEKLVFIKEARS